MSDPLVSIIIPTYNRKISLRKCVDSIIHQTYLNTEIIIVDDGSTDNTEKEIIKIRDDRIHYYKNRHSGVSHSRNVGIKMSHGKYIIFVDSDDLCMPDMAKTMIEQIDGYDLVCCNYIEKNGNNEKTSKLNTTDNTRTNTESIITNLDINGCLGQLWNKLFITEIIKKNSLSFDETISYGEDFRFILDYINASDKIKTINDVLYICNVSNNGLARRYSPVLFDTIIENTNYYKKFLIDNDYGYRRINTRYINAVKAGINNLFKAHIKGRRTSIARMVNNKNVQLAAKETRLSAYSQLIIHRQCTLLYISHLLHTIIHRSTK